MRVRILAWVLVLSAAGMAGAGGTAYVLASEGIDRRVDRGLNQEIQEFTQLRRQGVDPDTGRPFASVDRLLEVAMSRNVPDENQTMVAFLPDRTLRPGEVLPLHRDQRFRRAATSTTTATSGTYDSSAGELRYAAMPVTQDDRRGTFVAVYFAEREHAEFDEVVRSYVGVAFVALLLVGLVAWLTVGRLLAPVREVRRTALQISDSDLTRRITVTGHDDVSELARTFNAMLDRLEEAFATQREFLDDAGHELGTPITIVRGHIELLDVSDPDEVAETRDLVLDELDRMARLVEELVLLARARRPDFVQPRVFDLAELTDDVLDKVRALADRRWCIDQLAPVDVVADPQRLTQALVQLAQNAVAHTGTDDEIAVGSAADSRRVRLWVRDSGPGVPPSEREQVFDRFRRGSSGQRADGSGLGLAIVRAIAHAHGGEARVEQAAGGGAVVVLELPRDGGRDADRGGGPA